MTNHHYWAVYFAQIDTDWHLHAVFLDADQAHEHCDALADDQTRGRIEPHESLAEIPDTLPHMVPRRHGT